MRSETRPQRPADSRQPTRPLETLTASDGVSDAAREEAELVRGGSRESATASLSEIVVTKIVER